MVDPSRRREVERGGGKVRKRRGADGHERRSIGAGSQTVWLSGEREKQMHHFLQLLRRKQKAGHAGLVDLVREDWGKAGRAADINTAAVGELRLLRLLLRVRVSS